MPSERERERDQTLDRDEEDDPKKKIENLAK